jgi:hypothetical protein
LNAAWPSLPLPWPPPARSSAARPSSPLPCSSTGHGDRHLAVPAHAASSAGIDEVWNPLAELTNPGDLLAQAVHDVFSFLYFYFLSWKLEGPLCDKKILI